MGGEGRCGWGELLRVGWAVVDELAVVGGAGVIQILLYRFRALLTKLLVP